MRVHYHSTTGSPSRTFNVHGTPSGSLLPRRSLVARTGTTSPLLAPVMIVRSSAIVPSSRVSAHTTNASYTPSASGISTFCIVARVTVVDTDPHCATYQRDRALSRRLRGFEGRGSLCLSLLLVRASFTIDGNA